LLGCIQRVGGDGEEHVDVTQSCRRVAKSGHQRSTLATACRCNKVNLIIEVAVKELKLNEG